MVTVVLNRAQQLEATIRSILAQPLKDIEYIVVDGGSSDGTVDVLRKYNAHIDVWTSERDRGIYDAMNKALRHVRAKGHTFLGAGDVYVGEVLTKDIVIPGCLPVRYMSAVTKRPINARQRNPRRGMPYCNEGVIYETKGHRFDTTFRIAADYKYYLTHGYAAASPPLITTYGWVNVAFDTSRNQYLLGYRETNRIVGEFFGPMERLKVSFWTFGKAVAKGMLNTSRLNYWNAEDR